MSAQLPSGTGNVVLDNVHESSSGCINLSDAELGESMALSNMSFDSPLAGAPPSFQPPTVSPPLLPPLPLQLPFNTVPTPQTDSPLSTGASFGGIRSLDLSPISDGLGGSHLGDYDMHEQSHQSPSRSAEEEEKMEDAANDYSDLFSLDYVIMELEEYERSSAAAGGGVYGDGSLISAASDLSVALDDNSIAYVSPFTVEELLEEIIENGIPPKYKLQAEKVHPVEQDLMCIMKKHHLPKVLFPTILDWHKRASKSDFRVDATHPASTYGNTLSNMTKRHMQEAGIPPICSTITLPDPTFLPMHVY